MKREQLNAIKKNRKYWILADLIALIISVLLFLPKGIHSDFIIFMLIGMSFGTPLAFFFGRRLKKDYILVGLLLIGLTFVPFFLIPDDHALERTIICLAMLIPGWFLAKSHMLNDAIEKDIVE